MDDCIGVESAEFPVVCVPMKGCYRETPSHTHGAIMALASREMPTAEVVRWRQREAQGGQGRAREEASCPGISWPRQ